MKVKSLLSLAFLAGLGLNSANAAEQYIIKDGVVADGIEVLKYATAADGDAVESGATAPDGTTAAKITHQVMYNDVRFYSKAGIDLTKNWNLVIEFYYKGGTMHDTIAGNKWAALNMGLVDDTTGGKYGLDKAFVKFDRDIKYKNPADKWNTESMYIYAPAGTQVAHMMTFGWQRLVAVPAGDDTRAVYIKNMKFVGEGNKPFFAENFNNLGAVYSDASNMERFSMNDATKAITVYKSKSCTDVNTQMASSLPIYCERTLVSKQHVTAQRLWETLGTDGSAYYDCEQLQSLQILNSTLRDGNTYFFIPTAGLENIKEFNCSFLSKWCATMAEGLTAKTDKDSLSLPIAYEFVDAPADAFTATPTLFCDTFKIAGSWKAYKTPAVKMDASKKYLALVFETNPAFSYNVDDIQLTSTGTGDGQSFAGATVSTDPGAATTATDVIGVTAYTMTASQPAASVETVLSDAKLSIYPNPSADVVTVNNEGVQSVVVYGLDGAVKASANGNAINVSNLAKGIYIVKAYTAEGVIAGSIIKK